MKPRTLIVWTVLSLAVCLLLASTASGQTAIYLNPAGDIAFDSVDHPLAGSYRAGFFRLDTDTTPAVTESFLASAVTVPTGGGTVGLTYRVRTRPPFGRYVLRLKLIAPATCVPPAELPNACESDWSDPATWTVNQATGTSLGYTPAKVSAFLLR